MARMTNREKKALWVREAIEITDAHVDGGEGRFLCPLCLGWFTELDDLSLEHAPPKSVGGRHIAVTCRDCNSTAGHGIDAALRWTERVREFGTQSMKKPMPATFTVGGVEQRVEAIFDENGLRIGGIPAANHPDVAPAMQAKLDELVGRTDWSITLSFRTPDTRAASIGWLRAGFLAAFALYGYSWVLGIRDVADVRRQILEPDAEILERYCLISNQDTPRERLVGLIREPEELVSVLALTNGCAIFLPSVTGTYARLDELEWPPIGLHEFDGQFGPWPSRPLYSFDRWKLAGGDTSAPEPG